MKKVKKGLLFLVIIGVMLIGGIKLDVNAQNLRRRNEIQSKGNLKFENGEVYITVNDFIYLADEIDKLEGFFKCNLVDVLNQIGTFFKADGSITYDGSQNEVNSEELKTSLSFGSIKKGILESQSLESVKQLQATDKEGNLLYYKNESAFQNNEKLNFTTTDTGFPIFYDAAGAGNLSAGSAAWVNGVLMKGTGEDNKISWQNGYNEGYSQGVADSLGKAHIEYTYHKHSGNSSQVGGCYRKLTGNKPVYCGCSSYSYTELPGYEGHATCGNCYHNHSGTCNAVKSYTQYEYIGLICGKTEQTIEAATIIY